MLLHIPSFIVDDTPMQTICLDGIPFYETTLPATITIRSEPSRDLSPAEEWGKITTSQFIQQVIREYLFQKSVVNHATDTVRSLCHYLTIILAGDVAEFRRCAEEWLRSRGIMHLDQLPLTRGRVQLPVGVISVADPVILASESTVSTDNSVGGAVRSESLTVSSTMTSLEPQSPTTLHVRAMSGRITAAVSAPDSMSGIAESSGRK